MVNHLTFPIFQLKGFYDPCPFECGPPNFKNVLKNLKVCLMKFSPTSDWLIHTVVLHLNLPDLGEKDKKTVLRMTEYQPCQ